MMQDIGVTMRPAERNRIAGKMQVHERLRFDEKGKPGMYVFTTCKDFIRTLPAIPYDQFNPEDIDTDSEDHCLAGDTLVETSNGQLTIRDMCDTMGYILLDGKEYKYSDCRKTRTNAPTFKITTDTGKTIIATRNHRFLMADGTWKRLDELKIGDELKEASDESKRVERYETGV